MLDIRAMIDKAIALADVAAAVIPGAGLAEQGLKIGEKIMDIIDDLKHHADPIQQEEMQMARSKLAEAVKAKAKSTSDRLRG